MTAVVAIVAFLVGAGLGAAVAVWWLARSRVAEPSLDAAPSARPAGEAAEAGDDADADLKPILDATRGVLTDLEERYRGRRSGKSDE